MEIIDFSLNAGKRKLFENCNYEFKLGITHVLGSNGCGKTTLAKACAGLVKYTGTIKGNNNVLILSSFTNIPLDLTLRDIEKMIYRRFNKNDIYVLKEKLGLSNVSNNIVIKKLSDGQKQKIKLFVFLLANPNVVFLDEITTSLDKKTTHEIYDFLNELQKQKSKVIINITHNLSDIEYVQGDYAIIREQKIFSVDNKERVIEMYMKG